MCACCALRTEAATLVPGDPLQPWIDQALQASGGALPVVVLHPSQPVGTLIPQGTQPPQREGYAQQHCTALLLPESGPLLAVAQPVRDGFFAAYFANDSAAPGSIHFGKPLELLLGLDLPPVRFIRPQAGHLALFPSYLWHGTVPFSDDEPRLTFAFDMLPA